MKLDHEHHFMVAGRVMCLGIFFTMQTEKKRGHVRYEMCRRAFHSRVESISEMRFALYGCQ